MWDYCVYLLFHLWHTQLNLRFLSRFILLFYFSYFWIVFWYLRTNWWAFTYNSIMLRFLVQNILIWISFPKFSYSLILFLFPFFFLYHLSTFLVLLGFCSVSSTSRTVNRSEQVPSGERSRSIQRSYDAALSSVPRNDR